jgi:tetratricopeptide (TPR) repeat protein
VVIENTNTGQHFEVKTDKDGRYVRLGLPPGVYKITISDPRNKSFRYSEIHTLRGTPENDVSANFSKNIQGPAFAPQTKDGLENSKFNRVKAHVNAGVGAMYESGMLRMQLATTPVDKRGPLNEKLNADCDMAIREFSLAENLDPLMSVNNHAMVWAHLGAAYECVGLYDDATNAYEKAVSLRPEAEYYGSLSTAQANSALARTDPQEKKRRLAEADGACENAITLDSTEAVGCWKNIGVILINNGDMPDAIAPLQRAAQVNPKDAQGWFLLGRALLSRLETRQVDSVITTQVPLGAAEAFQKCIDAEPNGLYAAEARELLDGLTSMGAAGTAVIKKTN